MQQASLFFPRLLRKKFYKSHHWSENLDYTETYEVKLWLYLSWQNGKMCICDSHMILLVITFSAHTVLIYNEKNVLPYWSFRPWLSALMLEAYQRYCTLPHSLFYFLGGYIMLTSTKFFLLLDMLVFSPWNCWQENRMLCVVFLISIQIYILLFFTLSSSPLGSIIK